MNGRIEGRRKRRRGAEDGRGERQARAQVAGMGKLDPPGPRSSLRQLLSKCSDLFGNQDTFERLFKKNRHVRASVPLCPQFQGLFRLLRGMLSFPPLTLSLKLQPHHGAALQGSNHEAEKRKLKRPGQGQGV